MITAVDTSALAKLLLEEAESAALRRDLRDRADAHDDVIISALAITELRRITIRLHIPPEAIEPIVRPFRMVRLTDAMLQLASRLPEPHLGTLDAIHLATALSVEATDFVSYDAQQCEAAAIEGLRVASPGCPELSSS